MNTLQIFLLTFVVIETLNMLELYFMQDQCVFNGISCFSAWNKTRDDPEVHELIRYLVNWVAGMKLIVIALILVFVFYAPEATLIAASLALVITIGSFFWRMFPMLRWMDDNGYVSPRGKSRMLTVMILALEAGLGLAIGLTAFTVL
jgi:hypothetical protein